MKPLLFFLCALVVTPALGETFSGPVAAIDGDTVDVGGIRVRLFGIDAPEIGQTCSRDDGPWNCGVWARGEIRRAYQGRHATCEAVTIDKYQRVVARCRVDGSDISAALVAKGAAEAYRRYALDYVDAENRAALAGLGIWQGPMQHPADYRAAPAPQGCPIKGNLSANGRIYHLPGQENYAKTRIRTGKGERWFCTENDAISAGWRKAAR